MYRCDRIFVTNDAHGLLVSLFVTQRIFIRRFLFVKIFNKLKESSVATWVEQYGWKVGEEGMVTVSSQEEIIKTRNITEKIDIDSVASIMASCY